MVVASSDGAALSDRERVGSRIGGHQVLGRSKNQSGEIDGLGVGVDSEQHRNERRVDGTQDHQQT